VKALRDLFKAEIALQDLQEKKRKWEGSRDQVEAKMAEEKDAVEETKARLEQINLRSRSLNQQQEDFKEASAKLRKRMPEIRNNDEYSALLRELDSVSRRSTLLEEEQLQVLEEQESLQKEMPDLEARLAECQSSLSGELQQLEQERVILEKDLSGVEERQAKCLTQLGANERRIYDRLRISRGGAPFAPLRDHSCAVCHVAVRPAMEQALKLEEGLCRCEGCGRILMLEEPVATPS